MKTFAAVLIVMLATVARVETARADSYTCEVAEIDATKADTAHIDDSLSDLSKYLTKGPLAIYNHFVKLRRTSKTVEPLKSATFSLAKGAVTLLIREIIEKKANLDLGLDDESGKRWLDAKQKVMLGKFLLYSRTVSETESIVYAVGCK